MKNISLFINQLALGKTRALYSFIHFSLILTSIITVITLFTVAIAKYHIPKRGYDCTIGENLNISCNAKCYTNIDEWEPCVGSIYWVCREQDSNQMLCQKMCLGINPDIVHSKMWCYYRNNTIYKDIPKSTPFWYFLCMSLMVLPFMSLIMCCHPREFHIRVFL